jgi:hypothetical protein
LDAIPDLRLDGPSEFMLIHQESAEDAYRAVLHRVGCSLPNREVVDTRIIEEVRNGTATKGDKGFVNSPSMAGGWPDLKSLPAPADSDLDGMPDAWEDQFGLDANNDSDISQDQDSDGYTNIEEYLNGTDPTVFVDYTQRMNNVNTLR